MFDELQIHIRCKATVFAELLIGYSTHCMIPPSDVDPIMQIIKPIGTYAETRAATTEMVFGAGISHEFGQGVRYA